MSRYKIEPAEDMSGYGCACCSGESGARGFVYDGEEPLAVYFAEAGGVASKPVVLLGVIIGKWDGHTTKSERSGFVFSCTKENGALVREPTVPYLLAFPEFTQLGDKVEPEETPRHAEFRRVCDIIDAIVDQDLRFAHLRPDSAPRRSRFSAS